MSIVDLMVLGFLAERPHHGYELRRRIEQLYGYARPISDGTLYPAIRRLATNGYVSTTTTPGHGRAGRHTHRLTSAGREHLLDRLRNADGHDVTDSGRFLVVLAFLGLLHDRATEHAVLKRRLTFLQTSASFFYDGDQPLRMAEISDPYRRGMLLSARALSLAERDWITQELAS